MDNNTNSLSFHSLTLLWNRFAGGSTNRRIFGATLIVGFFTFSVKVASLLKELVVASVFGTSDALDAFLIAFLLPSFIVGVVAGSLNTAMIPTYIRVREKEGSESAQKLLSTMIVLALGILIATVALLAIAGPYFLTVMGSGFDAEKLALVRSLFYVLLPLIIFNGLITIYAAILNAEERFAMAAFIPAVVPIVSTVAILVLAPIWGVYTLAFGFLAGFGLQLSLLAFCLKKRNISAMPKWTGITPPVKQVIGQYLPMAAGAFLMSSTVLVDQSMAAMLEPGSVAALGYSNKIPATLLGIGALALGTAILPYYSKMVANGDWTGIDHTLKTYRWKILQVSVPLTLGFYFFSEPVVRILFERGAFTPTDTVLVGKVQAIYILQVPFFLLTTLIVRLVSSLRYNQLLMFGAMISLPLNIVMNYVLMEYFGLAGIAMSTVLVYAVSLLFLSIGLKNRLNKLRTV
jgi:putative peptidoglycan lipid II flippase